MVIRVDNSIIVYEDADLIIAHKPPGLATETARIGQPDLVSKLKNYRSNKGEEPYIGVVHRLDQPVEGLLAFAKTPKAAANLTAQLRKGTLKKSYTAIVDGHLPVGEEHELTDYLLKDSRTNLSKVVAKGTKNAKEAKLLYKCIENKNIDGLEYSVVQIEIFTGRHHQIRVQMSNAGNPLLGDNKYGNPHSKELSERLNINTTALLADKITLINPSGNNRMYFQTKPIGGGGKLLTNKNTF
jgi:23S rRNA pseudouridine1911/1915/1917 synthase